MSVRDEKLLLTVLLPTTLVRHEFLVPLDVTVEQGTWLMAHILGTCEPGSCPAADEADLMYREGPHAGEFVPPSETFRSLVLKDRLLMGSIVVMV